RMNRSPEVLVTGFCDWRALGPRPDLWRCRDNPSGRLLTGVPTEGPAPPLEGPLVRLLTDRADLRPAFTLLPVTWGAAADLEMQRFDAVIHLGLGVYDAPLRLQPERGAVNLRRGTDALGDEVEGPIEPGLPERIDGPPPVDLALDAVEGETLGAYTVRRAEA